MGRDGRPVIAPPVTPTGVARGKGMAGSARRKSFQPCSRKLRSHTGSPQEDSTSALTTSLTTPSLARRGGISKSVGRKSFPPSSRELRSKRRSSTTKSITLPTSIESVSAVLQIPTSFTNLPGSAIKIPPDLDHLKQEMNDNDKMFATLIIPQKVPEKDAAMKTVFCFRKICILYDNDPGDRQKEMICAMLDTGSSHTFIFASELRSLGLRYDHASGAEEFLSITNKPFKAIGTRQLFFKYRKIDKIHSITAHVLEDPSEDRRPNFDILLGRDHLIPSGALIGNPEVIGSSYFIAYRPAQSRD